MSSIIKISKTNLLQMTIFKVRYGRISQNKEDTRNHPLKNRLNIKCLRRKIMQQSVKSFEIFIKIMHKPTH